jgi:prepilin-type N-terminal cleavage/methylation domain-containing protein
MRIRRLPMERWNGNGFTLIELMIVIAIILILISIVMPYYLEAQIRAKFTKVSAELRGYDAGKKVLGRKRCRQNDGGRRQIPSSSILLPTTSTNGGKPTFAAKNPIRASTKAIPTDGGHQKNLSFPARNDARLL